MKLLKLYVQDFMCHASSFVDFSLFNSALIVGKVENNDLYSNGVGKTTIFKAIEYGLFNQADVNLEKIIRDDTNLCKIVLDCIVNDQEYRIIRTRTKKGTTDLSLYERTSAQCTNDEAYHTIDAQQNYTPVISEKFWKDISGRRAADTEKDLARLLKINFKSFRSTVHFMQNDFSGLTTATPEKRKGILKEALNLIIYSKLEKIAKDKSNILSKDIEKHKALIETLKNPDDDLNVSQLNLLTVEENISKKLELIKNVSEKISEKNEEIYKLTLQHSNLESKFANLVSKNKTLSSDKLKLESSVKEFSDKKTNIIKLANSIISDLKSLKDSQDNLIKIDFSQIESYTNKVSSLKEEITHNNIIIQNNIAKYEELKIPLPDDSVCKHCRQPLSEEHRKICQNQIDSEIQDCQKSVSSSKKKITELNAEIVKIQQSINELNASKKQLDNATNKIDSLNKELSDKKTLHKEYSEILSNNQKELALKEEEIAALSEELQNSSQEEANAIQSKIAAEKVNLNNLNNELSALNKENSHLTNTKAVILHTIEQKTQDKAKKLELSQSLLDLESKYKLYPFVLQAFSSTGIPNLIIQNVLDDLQEEANQLLGQLKPGLQLSFFIEKTKSDGTEGDTLDILYHINGKERHYDQLSGAQKLAVTFSLKLGLSFLLQKMIGTDIKFLLLDEIDQCLDKASVDAFADIVKFFQKEFTILVITHNDRLKDKISSAILVEQDINMVSRAKVVSSW